jgi:hypothetical protein
MSDWAILVASGVTAAGTLVLAGTTFSSVRSAQRSARAAEAAQLAAIRPVLVASRADDPNQKVGFIDDHWLQVPGGHGVIEVGDDVVYLAVSLQNVGTGLAVLDRWDLAEDSDTVQTDVPDIHGFRRLSRDIYVPAGQAGFWQGALRESADPLWAVVRDATANRVPLRLDLLYADHDGGQRTISRFRLRPVGEHDWLAAIARHWNLDRPDPR